MPVLDKPLIKTKGKKKDGECGQGAWFLDKTDGKKLTARTHHF